MAVRVCRPFNPAGNGIQACESTAFPPEANTNVLGETLDDADEILRPGMEIAPPLDGPSAVRAGACWPVLGFGDQRPHFSCGSSTQPRRIDRPRCCECDCRFLWLSDHPAWSCACGGVGGRGSGETTSKQKRTSLRKECCARMLGRLPHTSATARLGIYWRPAPLHWYSSSSPLIFFGPGFGFMSSEPFL